MLAAELLRFAPMSSLLLAAEECGPASNDGMLGPGSLRGHTTKVSNTGLQRQELARLQLFFSNRELPRLGATGPSTTVGGKRHGVEESGQVLLLRGQPGFRPRLCNQTFVRVSETGKRRDKTSLPAFEPLWPRFSFAVRAAVCDRDYDGL